MLTSKVKGNKLNVNETRLLLCFLPKKKEKEKTEPLLLEQANTYIDKQVTAENMLYIKHFHCCIFRDTDHAR